MHTSTHNDNNHKQLVQTVIGHITQHVRNKHTQKNETFSSWKIFEYLLEIQKYSVNWQCAHTVKKNGWLIEKCNINFRTIYFSGTQRHDRYNYEWNWYCIAIWSHLCCYSCCLYIAVMETVQVHKEIYLITKCRL